MARIYQNTVAEQEINAINQERSHQASEQLDMIYEQTNSASNLFFLDSEIENILRTGTCYEPEVVVLAAAGFTMADNSGERQLSGRPARRK
ncbi:MAG: hypothetical protein Q4C45_03005 [Oscillospiraceae bacterium]|nr:hypothetical protein [Oscillospiraceae bacterium]